MQRAVSAQDELLAASPTIADRTVYEGIGEGGDHSLAIDRRCEDAVFAELTQLADAGASFTAISEERGEVVFGDPDSNWRVVIDPIDGSLNARRTIPWFALSVAIASGPSMADVEWGFVHEFGTGEQFTARRGEGAKLGDRELRAEGPGYGLEVVGLESADPARIAPVLNALIGDAFRIRAIGSIAITLCYVAAGRLDGMLGARGCRSVDAAAAQLIVIEAGGAVEFAGPDQADAALALEAAGLGLDERYRVAAALDEEMLGTVRAAQDKAPTSV